jgi:acetyl esterase/lipase/glucose/arabinose dehydrogenase
MTRSLFRRHRRSLALPAALAALSLLSSPVGATTSQERSGEHEHADRHPDPSRAKCDPDNGGLTLPEGWCATVFADGYRNARQLTVTDDGRVYVAINNARDGSSSGGVVGLEDTDSDGHADENVRFGTNGGNGIGVHKGWLYFAMNDKIVRYRLTKELQPSGSPETIVAGLPANGDHVSKTIVFGAHDTMYVNIGSGSNSCQVANRTLESPGIDPCPELPIRSGVWTFGASTANQTQADGKRYATGLRNMVALDVEPESGALFGTQNGRDQLYENWPDIYSAEDDLVKPAEELFRIDAGGDYGWPYCYYDAQLGHKVLAPEYGGDGSTEGRCSTAVDPLVTFPAHWAALSMVFPKGHRFPAAYRNGAFVAFHGSRFDPASQPEGPGYNVAFVPFENGNPVGTWSEFAAGFAGTTEGLPASAAHRPVGLAEGPDGSLYMSDDVGGRIWKVIPTKSNHDSGKPTRETQWLIDAVKSFDAPAISALPPSAARNLPSIPDWLGQVAQDHGLTNVPTPVDDVRHITIPTDDEPLLARVYEPAEQTHSGTRGVLVYFHGGGWVLGNLSTYDASARALANKSGNVVVSVAYRQAPEHPFPGPVDDAYAAFTWIREHADMFGSASDRVAVGGESAGANLAAAVTLKARAEGVAQPAHQLLVYPVANYAFDTPSYEKYANAVPLDRASMQWFWGHYLSDPAQGANPLASPLRAESHAGLAPATVILAEIDPLQSEGAAYANALADDGVKTTLCLYKGVTHEFFGMDAFIPEAQAAQTAAAAGLNGQSVESDPACRILAS